MATELAIARRRGAVRDPEATRERILAAATSEFARHGLGGARVERIAARAGANKAMLYYYFSDKDDLFRAALKGMYEGIRSAEQRLQLLDLPPLEAIERLVQFTWAYYLEHPEFLSLLNSENLHEARHLKRFPQVRATNSLLVETLTEVLRRGEAQKAFRPGVDALQLYISIAALGYFYLTNNHTLSQAFDRDLGSGAAHRARLAHMTAVITGFLTNREPGKAPARRARSRQAHK